MTTLYTLAEKYRVMEQYANDILETEDGNDEDTLQMLLDTLESIEDSLENKVENIIKFLKSLEGDHAAYKAEKDRLAKREKSTKNKIDGLKQYTQDMLTLAKKDKIKAGVFNVRIQKSPPSVLITDAAKIPEEFREKQEDKILTKEILAALKTGEFVDGAELVDDKRHIRLS